MQFKRLYKNNKMMTHFSLIEVDNDMQKSNYLFDPTVQIIPTNVHQQSLAVDLIALFKSFQEYFSNGLTEDIQYVLGDMISNLNTFRPDEKSFEFLMKSELIDQIVDLFSLSSSAKDYIYTNIFQQTVQLILSLYSVSLKYEIPEIFEKINSNPDFDILDFVLSKINPNYENYEGQNIDLLNIDMNLFPHYLHMLSYYCFMTNEEIRDMILNTIILPFFNFLFSLLVDRELTSISSLLVCSSTILPLNKDQYDYIDTIFNFFTENCDKMDEVSNRYFFETLVNLTQNEDVSNILLGLGVDGFIDSYINQDISTVDDKSLKFVLILKNCFLIENPGDVTVNYEKLIEIENSKLTISKKVAFEVFRNGLELKEDENPFDDDYLFNYFIESLENGKFDMKSEFINVIDIWLAKSNSQSILRRALIILDELTQFLPQINVTDQLFLSIISDIKILFNTASKSGFDVLKKMKIICEENNSLEFLTDIQNDEEATDEVCSLVQSVLTLITQF